MKTSRVTRQRAWTPATALGSKVKDQVLIIGLVVALAAGFLIGRMSTPLAVTMQPAVPSNYDPTRQLAEDTLKAERDATEKCWQQVVTLLNAKATAH